MEKNNKDRKAELKKKILDKDNFNEMLDKTFQETDLNKNNYIEKNELAILLKSIYATVGLPPPSKTDIEQELERLDKNGDKKLSKQEFKVLVRDLCLYFIDQAE